MGDCYVCLYCGYYVVCFGFALEFAAFAVLLAWILLNVVTVCFYVVLRVYLFGALLFGFVDDV